MTSGDEKKTKSTTDDTPVQNPLGTVYALAQYDYLFDLALALAKDVLARPANYKTIENADKVVQYRLLHGNGMFSAADRQGMCAAFVGAPEVSSRNAVGGFAERRARAFEACRKYAEADVTESRKILGSRVRSELDGFREYVEDTSVGVLSAVVRALRDLANASWTVLTTVGVPGLDRVETSFEEFLSKGPTLKHGHYICVMARSFGVLQDIVPTAERVVAIGHVATAGQRAVAEIIARMPQSDIDDADDAIAAVYDWLSAVDNLRRP